MVRKLLITDFKKLSPLDSTEIAVNILKNDSFVVIEEEGKFIGLLTADDLIFSKKKLIGDTLKPKPILSEADSVNTALDKILKSGFPALPCVEEHSCIGVFVKDIVFNFLFDRYRKEDFIAEKANTEHDETKKTDFLNSICHHTKNHLQILYSGFKLLEDSNLDNEQKDIISALYKSTNRMEQIIIDYLKEYFDDELIKNYID